MIHLSPYDIQHRKIIFATEKKIDTVGNNFDGSWMRAVANIFCPPGKFLGPGPKNNSARPKNFSADPGFFAPGRKSPRARAKNPRPAPQIPRPGADFPGAARAARPGPQKPAPRGPRGPRNPGPRAGNFRKFPEIFENFPKKRGPGFGGSKTERADLDFFGFLLGFLSGKIS